MKYIHYTMGMDHLLVPVGAAVPNGWEQCCTITDIATYEQHLKDCETYKLTEDHPNVQIP